MIRPQDFIERLQDELETLKSDCEVFGATPEDIARMSKLKQRILKLKKSL